MSTRGKHDEQSFADDPKVVSVSSCDFEVARTFACCLLIKFISWQNKQLQEKRLSESYA